MRVKSQLLSASNGEYTDRKRLSGKTTRKAEQETAITPERGVDYGVGDVPVAANATLPKVVDALPRNLTIV
jgi:hypothetical protein